MVLADSSRQGLVPATSWSLVVSVCRPYRTTLVVAALLFTLGAVLGLSPYVAVFFAAREVIQDEPDAAVITGYAAAGLAGVVLRYVLVAVANSLAHRVAFQVEFDLRLALAEKMGRLPLGYFTSRSVGEVRRSLTENVAATHSLIAHYLNDVSSAVLAPVVIFVFLLVVDWRLGLASAALVPLAVVAYFGQFAGRMAMRLQQADDLSTEVGGAVVDYINGMAVARAYGQSAQYFARLASATADYDYWRVELTRRGRYPWSTFEVLIGATLVVVLPVATWLHLEHGLSLQEAILFLVAAPALTLPLHRVVYVLFGAIRALRSIAHTAELLAAPELPEPAEGAVPSGNTIVFDRVTFAYDDESGPAIEDVSFIAREGTVTALVGPSGAGKTTIARLVPRFWDVTSGAITIGGVDVRAMRSDDLLSCVSFVFQDVFLLDGTIAENIRAGRPGATDDEVEAAAEAARVAEFARLLPQGLATPAGEKGVRLSAGEKQRVAVARALLKDAPILILDEATASADPDNEAAIQEAISVLAIGRTVLVIAHRLATVAGADTIVMLEGGRMVGAGSQPELLERSAGFRRLWDAQRSVADWSLDLSGASS